MFNNLKKFGNLKSLEGIKEYLETEISNIISGKNEKLDLDKITVNYKEYGKVIKNLIRIMLNNDKASDKADTDYESHQNRLTALSIDYIWRCILFMQERVLKQNRIAIREVVKALKSEYTQKYSDIEQELEMKNKLLEQIKREFSIEYSMLNKKLENSVQEKERINQIAEDRYFELKCVKNEVDINALKTYVKDLDKNLMQAMNEKKPQMDAWQKLINIMKRLIPAKNKGDDTAPK